MFLTNQLLSDSNVIRTHNHLVHKLTLKHFGKLANIFLNDWAML